MTELVCMVTLIGTFGIRYEYREISFNALKLEKFYFLKEENIVCPKNHTYIPEVGCFNISTRDLSNKINKECRK